MLSRKSLADFKTLTGSKSKMAGRAQRLTQILEIVATRLQELGINHVADGVSAIRKEVENSVESMEGSSNRKQDEQGLLMTALERALQNSRGIRRQVPLSMPVEMCSKRID